MNDTIIFEDINCPLCGGNERQELFTVDHRESNVLSLLEIDTTVKDPSVVQCKKCGHYYMTPVVASDLMDKYYSIINSEFYHNAGIDSEINYNEKEYDDYYKIISAIKPGGKVLEVGCGKGMLLNLLKKKGYDTYGIEPSPVAYKYAKESLKLNVDNQFLHNSRFRNEKFDVVILIDVVEHILNMRPFLDDLKSVLKEGGLIFIGTGNIDSFNARFAGNNWFYYYTWEHVSFFTDTTMRTLLQQNGFKDIKVRKISLQHKPLLNFSQFIKNIFKKLINPFLKKKYYHGLAYDHILVTATNESA